MKKLLFEKTYQLFLLVSGIAFCIFIFFKGLHPDSLFDVSIYNYDISISMSWIWFVFSVYLFSLALLYFLIGRSKLRTKRWMIILHLIFILLFLIFFVVFSSFANHDIQKLMVGIPFSTLITIYGLVFFADVVFFILGFITLLLNLFNLKREKYK